MKVLHNAPAKTLCADRMHSDTVKEKYGATTQNILYQDKLVRQTMMMDEHNIARTYAAITLNTDWQDNREMREVDEAIRRGESISEAFCSRGFMLRKNILDVYASSLTARLRRSFSTTAIFAKACNAEFIVKKGRRVYNYAVMVEIYSPDLYAAMVTDEDIRQVNFSFYTLRAAGFSSEEVWRLIGNEATDWSTSLQFEHL